jgi:hypothetical protein
MGGFCDECLNAHWWQDLDEARRDLQDRRRDYNERRPHSSLADLVPSAYVASLLDVSPTRLSAQVRGWTSYGKRLRPSSKREARWTHFRGGLPA